MYTHTHTRTHTHTHTHTQSVKIADFGMIGLVSSTATAWFLDMDSALLHSGLYGYNGILVGLCIATFHYPRDRDDSSTVYMSMLWGWDAVLILPIIGYSAFSTIIWYTFSKVLFDTFSKVLFWWPQLLSMLRSVLSFGTYSQTYSTC